MLAGYFYVLRILLPPRTEIFTETKPLYTKGCHFVNSPVSGVCSLEVFGVVCAGLDLLAVDVAPYATSKQVSNSAIITCPGFICGGGLISSSSRFN
jgi:hypothetical protein